MKIIADIKIGGARYPIYCIVRLVTWIVGLRFQRRNPD